MMTGSDMIRLESSDGSTPIPLPITLLYHIMQYVCNM